MNISVDETEYNALRLIADATGSMPAPVVRGLISEIIHRGIGEDLYKAYAERTGNRPTRSPERAKRSYGYDMPRKYGK